jgi:hypothetical protein
MSQIVTSSLSAEALATLDSVNAYVTQQCHVASAGTGQITSAQIDRQINVSYQEVAALDLMPVPYAKWDTIATAAGTFLYALNSDFVEGGLIWCSKMDRDPASNEVRLSSVMVSPTLDVTVPAAGDPVRYVFASHDYLFVNPVPQRTDSLILYYQAMPSLLAADSTLRIDYHYRDMVAMHACWKIKEKLGLSVEAASYAAMYFDAKRKRTATKMTSEQVIE